MSQSDSSPKTYPTTNHLIVSEIYRSLLGREPDGDGLDDYVHKLKIEPIHSIMNHIMTSEEFKTRIRKIIAQEDAASSKFSTPYTPPGEFGGAYAARLKSGFLDKYCNGALVLDVGYSGYDNPEKKTAILGAIGVDLDYPGYDGLHLPFDDDSVDTIISSHCLEHILSDLVAIRDWYRVLKVGGFMVCMVPHQALYEKRRFLPSIWNEDHKRMYTPASLLASFEQALAPNSYRVRHLADNDAGFDYAIGPDRHSVGSYEIELVLEKIALPVWTLA